MKILALESSAVAASAALCEDEMLLGQTYLHTGLTHSQTLMVMAENLLHQCGKTVNDVNAVAVAAARWSASSSSSTPRRCLAASLRPVWSCPRVWWRTRPESPSETPPGPTRGPRRSGGARRT